MRYLLALLAVFAAQPALSAQAGAECRGKKTFELSDGTAGCLLKLAETGITRTLSRDDGQSRSRQAEAVIAVVGVYGSFDTRMKVTSTRLKEICTVVMPAMKQASAGKAPDHVIVQMLWPGVALPQPTRSNGGEHLNQVAELNASCRSPQYFGTRSR